MSSRRTESAQSFQPALPHNMYEKSKALLLLNSASALTCNLALRRTEEGSDALAVIHGGSVNVTPTRAGSKSYYLQCFHPDEKWSSIVTQVMWCYLGCEHVLAIASTRGLQIFSANLYEPRFYHPCSEGGDSYARGLADPVGSLCVGDSRGELRMFRADMEGVIVMVDHKRHHKAPVTDAATWDDLMVTCDDSGNIVLWDVSVENLDKKETIRSFGSPCTGVKIWKDSLVAVYGSGHIRLFSISSENNSFLALEINAHAKWITALDLAPRRGYILTTSEDSFAKVWKISRGGENPKMSHKFSTQIKDCFLVGAKFLTPCGSSFAVSLYDTNVVQCFRMVT